MRSASVVTLASGREEHLRNMLAGLTHGSLTPRELVLVCMNGWRPPTDVHGFGLKIREAQVDGRDVRLPLAAARNAGARAARTEALVFLDVDCVPAPDLVASYLRGLSRFDGILMGEVRYLPPHATRGFRETGDHRLLLRRSAAHPSRTIPPPGGPSPAERYEEFWSLSFAVRRQAFLSLGGFDEGFVGYGGEDTDFAFEARRRGVPLAWIDGARAFHQHHETCDPPLQHLGDIVSNAKRFKDKWDEWPMVGWLSRFARMGLVRWTPEGDALALLRAPTPEEVEAHTRRNLPGT